MDGEEWHAAAYEYSKDYIRDEEYARENKLGIWEGSFIMPESGESLINFSINEQVIH